MTKTHSPSTKQNRTKQNRTKDKKWSFWIDRGGTFTDIIAQTPTGEIQPIKLLSENPTHYQDAAIEGIRRALKLEAKEPIPANIIDTIKMGTTVATNALLEHAGQPTLLLTSEGLADVLEIGTQARQDIFALNISKPKMLYTKTIAIEERLKADGTTITPLNEAATKQILQQNYDEGLSCVAILFMHSYKYPANEQMVAKLAREIGYTQISQSHQVSPLIKYIPRGDTTMIDAYLTPILHHYTKNLATILELARTNIKLSFMTSTGALTSQDKFNGKDAILSGPAGGIVGAAKTAAKAGINNILCFDMGGTSTDVAHFAGTYDLSFETEISGHRLQSPMLHIHTVAAGGGSILTFKNNRMAVGPESAGAQPGPCSYRAGGPLTITDANLMTGRISAEHFPHIFGQNHNQPLDLKSVQSAFEKRAKEISQTTQSPLSAADCAEGYIRIANENMAAAIKKISVERGIDIKDYTLQCYGGAGGQHAAAIAERLGLKEIYIHAQSSLLSAYGMGLAKEAARRSKMLATPLHNISRAELEQQAEPLIKAAKADLTPKATNQSITCYLSYQASETKIPVPLTDTVTMQSEFETAHQKQFGFLQKDTSIIIQQLDVEVSTETEINSSHTKSVKTKSQNTKQAKTTTENPIQSLMATHKIFHNGTWQKAALYHETTLSHETTLNHKAETSLSSLTDKTIKGPALIITPHQTIFAPSGWSLSKNSEGHITMRQLKTSKSKTTISTTKPDPIRLELFNSLFMSIAEQMGEALRATAQSVNIKERLDFSCAIFDAKGALIANAPHMPVHLGSMDRAVEAVIKANTPNSKNTPDFKQGDAFMINAPYNGGTHLPDITVITPVFNNEKLIAFVASRGHHADIGGIAPGSMSPNATTIHEEGILIDCFKLVENDSFQQKAAHHLLTDHQYPARNPNQNIADLKAQLAANAKGIKELGQIILTLGEPVLTAYMGFVQSQAEQAVKSLIQRLSRQKQEGSFKGAFTCHMDQGTKIQVNITPNEKTQTLTIDFTGTSKQTNNNFNAPEPVTRAAVLYVLRTLIADNIPMNAGCLKPVKIIIPEKTMLTPQSPAAVVAGNVETSQVITNCLYGAFGALGLAQGTMNNLTFGNETHQYYETLCSGAPAGPPYNGKAGFNGAAAIHTHMTNSRLTDPEILETRYPVLLKTFRIDKNSGGQGTWCAGDGITRSLQFLEKLECALLTGYRDLQIPGINGASPGRKGENFLEKANGDIQLLSSCCSLKAEKNDILTIKTPTGGGFNPAKNTVQT